MFNQFGAVDIRHHKTAPACLLSGQLRGEQDRQSSVGQHRLINLLQQCGGLFRVNSHHDAAGGQRKSSTPDPSRRNSGFEATSQSRPASRSGIMIRYVLLQPCGRSAPARCSSQSPGGIRWRLGGDSGRATNQLHRGKVRFAVIEGRRPHADEDHLTTIDRFFSGAKSQPAGLPSVLNNLLKMGLKQWHAATL